MSIGENVFSVHPVIKENLDALSRTLAREVELRSCEWASVAEQMADLLCLWMDDGLSVQEALVALIGSFSDATGGSESLFSSDTPFSRAYERFELCRLLAEQLTKRGRTLREEDFLLREDVLPVVAYVKNPYADEAYDVFAAEMPDLAMRYVSSFDEGVRQLLAGEVGYCLLPFEESGGIRLSTVERLVHRHDLRIARVTPVFGPDATADLRYALLCQSVCTMPCVAEDDRYLELRLPFGAEASLSDLSVPTECLGLSLYRVQTVSFGIGEDRDPYLSAVLCGQGADFSVLLLYLSMFCPEATVVGLYRNLES